MSDIYLSLTESPTVVTLSQPVVSGVLSSNVTVTNVVSVNVVTMPAINVTAAAPSVTTVAGSVAVSNFPSVTTVAGTVALDANSLSALENVTVTVGAAVTVAGFSTSSLPPSTVTVGNTVTINGTVTANLANVVTNDNLYSSPAIRVMGAGNDGLILQGIDESGAGGNIFEGGAIPVMGRNNAPLPISGTVTVGNAVTIGSLPAISGTVTANVASVVTINSSGASFSQRVVSKSALQFTAIAGAIDPTRFSSDYTVLPVKITSETDGLNLAVDLRKTSQGNDLSAISNDATAAFVRTQVVGGSVTIGSLPAISGTVTANSIFPRVTLIDGSGTVATANTAITVFASSSTRSYLLVQVTTGSAFVNVGATATTVNGINLTAGQGYSWETTIPQGIVSLISTTTSSRYVAKEA